MASSFVVLIILGCVTYQYLKGTLVKSFAAIITTICASVVAFGYFEILAGVFISRSGNTRHPAMVPWAQPLCFILLFVLTFAILQTIAAQLTRKPINLGFIPERIGRVIGGIFLGLILSGLLLTALAMAPLPNKYPYQRFDRSNPDAENPGKAFPSADGFATGWFNIISSGSLSGKRSFATLHTDFLDQLFLNRHNIADDISIVTSSNAIEVPRKKAAWPAPEDLKDSDGRPVSPKSGHSLTIVRVGIKKTAVKDGGKFTLSQIRLVCNKKNSKNPLAGRGKGIYPVGYLKTANQLQEKRLNDQIEVKIGDFTGKVKYIDFAFHVPDDSIPVLVELKQNSIAEVPPPVTAEQAPPAMPFIQLSNCAGEKAELRPIGSAKVYGVELAAGSKFLADLTLKIDDPNQWQNAQTDRSIRPVQFTKEIDHVRAELKIPRPDDWDAKTTPRPAAERPQRKRRFRKSTTPTKKTKDIPQMLKPLDGYRLLSLKCNNPSTGVVIKAKQLPVLVELSGLIHYPVGVIASGEAGDQIIYEVDYCSLTAEDIEGGLTITEDGAVAQPFPDTIWLTEQVQSISEFYVLYLVESGRNAIITLVQSGDSQAAAGFKGYEGFFVK